MLHDLANADRVVIAGEQVENANPHRIGKRFEATCVLLRARLGDPGRLHWSATTGSRAFWVSGHGRNQGLLIHRQMSMNTGFLRQKMILQEEGRNPDSGLVDHEMVAGVRFELTTFGLCDLTQLSLRVGLYLHPA